jgi:hypothetical protein
MENLTLSERSREQRFDEVYQVILIVVALSFDILWTSGHFPLAEIAVFMWILAFWAFGNLKGGIWEFQSVDYIVDLLLHGWSFRRHCGARPIGESLNHHFTTKSMFDYIASFNVLSPRSSEPHYCLTRLDWWDFGLCSFDVGCSFSRIVDND